MLKKIVKQIKKAIKIVGIYFNSVVKLIDVVDGFSKNAIQKMKERV